MLKQIGSVSALSFLLSSLLTANAFSQADRQTISIDASAPTGEVHHGATGWLYGQSQPGIPPVYMMELLKPQIAAQKAPAGLQHPGGDAMEVMPDFKAAGGKLMQIYVQDIYPSWPYNDNGLDDYMKKIAEVAHKVVADPHRDDYVYVPFNEPDNNWYGYTGPKFDRFLHDWLAVYKEIRSIDSTAKIAGPNYEHLKPATYEAFYTFARDNNVLPDETTWHELHDDFFTDWYSRYDSYRAMEKRLGIAPIPIVINEYTRIRGDLGVPGNLVQWITRLENSKVDGCLAFWTPTGTMADLTARVWPNRATGAWWVYYWYAEMTGQTLKLTPPDLNAVGLQGIASADDARQQLRVLFGGTGNGVDVKLSGLAALPHFGKSVHVAVWRADNTRVQPSPGPLLISQSDVSVTAGVDAGSAEFSVPETRADAAYYAVVTPSSGRTTAQDTGYPAAQDTGYPAIYATLAGAAKLDYQAATVSLPPQSTATFPMTAVKDGYYTVSLRYQAHRAEKISLSVNDMKVRDLDLVALAQHKDAKATLFLAGGINALKLGALKLGALPRTGIRLISLDLAPATGAVSSYPAADAALGRGAALDHGEQVNLPAGDAAATLSFNHISARAAGKYKLIVTYSNDEKGHKGAVDEQVQILVNKSAPIVTYFRQTFDAAVFCTKVIDIDLKAGSNAIQIAALPGHRGPTVSQIQIARAQLN